jgi:hypothetical protein
MLALKYRQAGDPSAYATNLRQTYILHICYIYETILRRRPAARIGAQHRPQFRRLAVAGIVSHPHVAVLHESKVAMPRSVHKVRKARKPFWSP